ncbi:HpcH/HpaI aldolase/citrate lyase family protein [Dactylosporangium sucinum]|uniref:CoA ester lyase n=1 Tax=Dactylosporangium sucinum TaxID=1424081 RepID=A0A917WQ70_9ACTN|nr:CoA ester lyase [Dactylosporangium sucinum]GGM20865.1 CoA ester lyase [Dactylosporangium sucinum]
MRPYRSVLFVPGHRPGWVEKAAAAGADAVVLDLEDSVPDAEKAAARATVAASVARLRAAHGRIGIGVRVNPLATGLAGADLEEVVVPGLDFVFPPKLTGPDDVIRFDALLDHFERRNGVAGLELLVPTETIGAIEHCAAIAAGPRVGGMIGPTAEHADITRVVGFEWTPEGDETLYLRSRILLACRGAGVHPVTGLWERLDDLDGLRDFALRGRRLGFRGMIAIHPRHVPVINEVFSPGPEQVAFYRGLAEAYERASAAGTGAVRYRGVHVDKAHYDTALEWLATHADEGDR